MSLPRRLFDGDLDRYAAEIGIGPALAALLSRGGSGVPATSGRADAYHDGTAYKLREFNLGSEIGGLEMAVCNQGLLRVPEFAEFARVHRLGHVDIAARMAAVPRDRARPAVSGGGEPVVGLIEGRGGVASYGRMTRAAVEAMAEQGLDLRIGEIGDVRTGPSPAGVGRCRPQSSGVAQVACPAVLSDDKVDVAIDQWPELSGGHT
ncbi:hypothetical protein ACFV5J_16735 [Streptomyces zaomyceticus]|uniref:hypothetical protein n=1 Tax=Streptomyces zaomyceticus TaxID=68286 RepID=UPI003669EDD9